METMANFEARVLAVTGHYLSAIPEGTRNDAIGPIVARHGNTLVVWVRQHLDDEDLANPPLWAREADCWRVVHF